MLGKPNERHPHSPQGRLLVALEGPCCAGKTTLAKELARHLLGLAVYVECFADHAGGGHCLPKPVPESLEEDAQAMGRLLEVEESRMAPSRLGNTPVIILDRSVHTFLAHRCAIEQLTGLACLEPARQILIQSRASAWPNLVIYLDVPQTAVQDRNNGKFQTGNILVEPAFNNAFRSYFAELRSATEPQVAWLDAMRPIQVLTHAAVSTIREALANRRSRSNGTSAALRKGGIR
ncbi:AAA family ATPase [Nonomuraea sp. NN258]|uniref:AAA family ATPase n=1 Tax=Nonomuraea antri TaxID=2730852 RepID=UPI00156A36F3|nr:AAA family ATPase [Nonomuraea antri]NRQ37976.1 AAA family ATPase [Nonomuraea antri]